MSVVFFNEKDNVRNLRYSDG